MQANSFKILALTILIGSSSAFAQNYNQRNGQIGGRQYSVVPRSNTEPSTEDNEKEFQEKLDVYIKDFVDKLEVDEFQKHIIKQKLGSYFVQKRALFKSGIENRQDLEEKVKRLDNNHFNDLKGMTPEHIQDSIQNFINTKPKESSKKKKKGKKKRKKER